MGKQTTAFVLFFSLALHAADSPPPLKPAVGPPVPVPEGGLRHVAEFRFDLQARYQNPYDPDQVRVDAEVKGPGGRKWSVPAFWFEPYTRKVEERKLNLSAIRTLRFFLSAADFPAGARPEFVVDDIEVFHSRTGARKVIEDAEGEPRWKAGRGVHVERIRENPHGGASGLLVRVTITKEDAWPGLDLALKSDDWSAYDSLRVWFRPVQGVSAGAVGLEFYTAKGEKYQTHLTEPPPDAAGQAWQETRWRFAQAPLPRSTWSSAGAGSWRLRIAVPEDGEYSIRLRAKQPSGEAESETARFDLHRSDPDGFLRVDPKTHRYFRFESGRPYLANGTNLISGDVAVYEYYLRKFAAAGCNFLRFWMSGYTLGIERRALVQYDEQRAAAVDALVNAARDLDTRLMFCLTDFREAGDGSEHYWADTAYGKVCRTPLEFFSSDLAREPYRKRLRYIVARWSASTAVHSWEFFNEVNITNQWSYRPQVVRWWHEDMAKCLAELDPYRHPITSSFAGIKDDPLWDSDRMEIVQRHEYPNRFVSLADELADGTRILRRHGKPVLVGEFGRHSANLYAEADREGVSLHEGIWAPPLSGAAGTGMPWWWEWIDEHDLYRHFAAFSGFVKDVRWHEERFVPFPAEALETSLAQDDDASPPENIRIMPASGSWNAAPFNRPVTVTVHNDGTLEPKGLIAGVLHGFGNHPDLHNPQTYRVSFSAPGRFALQVDGVSGHGGSGLRISLDGAVRVRRDFEDLDPNDTATMTQYNGWYGVDVPAGEHEIEVEATGTDWFVMPLVTLTNYGRLPVTVTVLGLRGRQMCLFWARNTRYVWYAPLVDLKPRPARDVVLRVPELPEGEYELALFDPQTGKWLERKSVTNRGVLEIPLGTILKDVAVRLTRK